MDRTNFGLALALAVALLMAWLLAPSVATRSSSGPAFESFAPAAAMRVELDREGKHLVLERDEQGAFGIAELFGFPVAPQRVERVLLEPLAALTRADRAAATSAGFGFESSIGVDVLGHSERLLASFDQSLGRTAPRGGSFVRPLGGDVVLRANGLPALDVAPAAWWDGRLVTSDPATVRGFVIEFPSDAAGAVTGPAAASLRRVVFERTSSAEWTVDGAPATSPVAIESAALALTRLRLVDVVADSPATEHGLEAPALVFELIAEERGGGRTTTRIALGFSDEHGRIFATSSAHAQPWVVLVDSEAANAVVAPIAKLLGR